MLHAMHGNMFTNPLIVVGSLQPSTAKLTLYSFSEQLSCELQPCKLYSHILCMLSSQVSDVDTMQRKRYDCVVEREEYGHSYIDAAHMIKVILGTILLFLCTLYGHMVLQVLHSTIGQTTNTNTHPSSYPPSLAHSLSGSNISPPSHNSAPNSSSRATSQDHETIHVMEEGRTLRICR